MDILIVVNISNVEEMIFLKMMMINIIMNQIKKYIKMMRILKRNKNWIF